MRRLLAAGLLALALPAPARADDDLEALLAQALEQLVENAYVGDTSAPERYLAAILEQEPDHLEARWQLLYIRLVPLTRAPLSERAEGLAALSPAFAPLAKLAGERRQQAFLHFMTATHAALYNDYERALAEIDRAVALEPRSARYLTAKGRLHVEHGRWTKSDEELERGIAVLNRARELLRAHLTPFVRDAAFDFHLARAMEEFSRPRWKEAAEHYLRFIENSRESTVYAYAWNNASIAYRKLGECTRALEAAEKALAVMKFGTAQSNKRSAEFCLEMQKFGLTAGQ